MPKKYLIELPSGEKYEVEEPDQPGSVSRGAVNELKEQAGGIKELGGALRDLARNVLPFPGQSKADAAALPERQKASLKGFWQGALEGGKALFSDPTVLDPTGMSGAVKREEPLKDKIGRGLVIGAETVLPFLKNLGKAGRAAKAGATGGGVVTRAGFGTSAMKVPEGGVVNLGQVADEAAKQSGIGSVSVPKPPPPTTPPGFGSTSMRAPSGPIIGLSQLADDAAATSGKGAISVPAPKPPVAVANAAAKAEQVREGIKPPYREPVYGGPERRSATRVTGQAEDKAYQRVRKEIEDKAARQRAQAMLTPKEPTKASAPIPTGAKATEAPRPQAGGKPTSSGKKPTLVGMAKTTAETAGKKTVTLEQMVAQYGPEEAAKRAGMTVDELLARAGAKSEAEVAQRLRDRLGADRAGRLLGMPADEVRKLSGGGPSKIPTSAVEKIKAATAGKAELTPQESALLDRIKAERGAVNPKALLPIAGAGVGLVADQEDPLLGALIGGGLGLAAPNVGKIGKLALDLRRESMLTGAAIPKNLASALGGSVALSAEKGSMAPLQEMLRLPENAKVFARAFSNPQHKFQSHVAGATKLPKYSPSNVISAIDQTATEALTRAGIPVEDIERILLTKSRNWIGEGFKAAGPGAEKVGQAVIPFQRTPANAVFESAGEVAHLGKNPLSARSAATGGSALIGWAIGEWAKENPKRRGPLAGIALAALGSRAALGTMVAATRAGRQVVGGVSPIPEMAFDFNTASGWPPAGVKFWKRIMGND